MMLFIVTAVIILLYLVLFTTKNPIQFHVKYFTYVAITLTYSVLILPFCLLRPCDLRNVKHIARSLTWVYKIFRIKIEVENRENLNKHKAYILVANHQSSIDYIVMMKCWPKGNCTPLAKKELIYAGPFGLVCWLSGVTFIDRLNHEKAKSTIEELATRINKENLIIWIYPEGTRNANNELLTFKKGAFHLAVQAQIPIVPLVISSYSHFYSKKEKKFLPGTIKVRVLNPIETKDLVSDDVAELTKKVHDDMQSVFTELNSHLDSKVKAKSILESAESDSSFDKTQ